MQQKWLRNLTKITQKLLQKCLKNAPRTIQSRRKNIPKNAQKCCKNASKKTLGLGTTPGCGKGISEGGGLPPNFFSLGLAGSRQGRFFTLGSQGVTPRP